MAHRLLNDFKKFAELAVEEIDKDDKISLMLSSAEKYIKDAYNIAIQEETIVQTFDGEAVSYITLSYAPTALTSVVLDGDIIDNVNFSIRDNVLRYLDNIFTIGYDNVVVTYTTGYADTDIPGDLKLALFKLANKFYIDADEERDGVSSYQTNTKTGVYYEVQHLPTSFEILINPYRLLFF